MNVNIGELNKRILFVSETQDQYDDDGFPIKGSKTETKAWAKVWNSSGTELVKANSDFSKIKTHFIVRYRKDFMPTESMTIKFGSKEYNITYVNEYNFSHEFVEVVGEVISNV